jgi:hypothetical protein
VVLEINCLLSLKVLQRLNRLVFGVCDYLKSEYCRQSCLGGVRVEIMWRGGL